MPDTCFSSEIPQIQQISALPNESLGKSWKWSMYSSGEGKMQMKTNAKSLPFMFQVPNYAWHFNFPKACLRKIVLNSPGSVKASISSSRGVRQVRLSSVWGVKCNHCKHCNHCTAGMQESHGWASPAALQQGTMQTLCPSHQLVTEPSQRSWLGLLTHMGAHFVPFLGIQDVYHWPVGCFTRGSLYYVSIARRSRVLWRSLGEICNH